MLNLISQLGPCDSIVTWSRGTGGSVAIGYKPGDTVIFLYSNTYQGEVFEEQITCSKAQALTILELLLDGTNKQPEKFGQVESVLVDTYLYREFMFLYWR